MADTPTTNFALIKPDINDPAGEDLWGGKLNTNFDTIDAVLKTNADAIATKAGVGTANTFTKPQKSATAALTSAVAWDGSDKQHLTVDVNGANFTIADPSVVPSAGTVVLVYVKYTTTHTLAWGSKFKGMAAVTGSNAAGKRDIYAFRSDGTNLERYGYSLDAGA